MLPPAGAAAAAAARLGLGLSICFGCAAVFLAFSKYNASDWLIAVKSFSHQSSVALMYIRSDGL
jgi:hypothetical protein